MAWNDPFEALVDSIVDDLGTFLQEEENLEIMTIMQTQEICRDFCNFLCKDVHKATSRDYTVYTQLHAFTPEEEEEYAVKLGYIKAFCQATQDKNGDSATQININERPRKPSVSLKDRALMRDRRATQSIDTEQFRIDELMMMSEQDENALKSNQAQDVPVQAPKQTSGSIAAGKPDLRSKDLSAQELEKASRATPKKTLKALEKGDANHETKPGFSQTSLNKISVSDSLDMIVNKAKKRGSSVGARNDLEQFEDNNYDSDLGQFRINPNESFAIPVNSEMFQQVAEEIDNTKDKEPEQNNQENAASQADDADSADFMRGVEGVNYDFSSQNIRKMREFEKKQAKKIQPVDTGEALNDDFRPYIFDAKYLIDIPVPNAAEMTPVKVSPINRYLFPLAPAIVAFALALLMFTLSVILGLIFFLVGLGCVVAVLADIKPASQQTPQAVIMSYLNARQGRCYGCGLSMLAQPTQAQQPIDLHAAWQPENTWTTAIKKRFRPEQPPETRLVTSSAKKDAQIIFYMVGVTYYLVPMVQIDGKWYITSPKLPPHEMA